MRKIITLFAVAALMLTAVQTAQADNYNTTIGTRYELQGKTCTAVPLECTLSITETGAALSFQDKGLHVFKATAVEKVSDDIYIFTGFDAILPDGTRGRFVSAQETEDGLLVVFRAVGCKTPHTYYFSKD